MTAASGRRKPKAVDPAPGAKRGPSKARTSETASRSGSAAGTTPPPAPTQRKRPNGWRIRLFDADRTDHELSFEAALTAAVGERQLLWIDGAAPMDAEGVAQLAERLGLKPATRALLEEDVRGASIALHGTYFTLTVATIASENDREDARWLTIVAAQNVVMTVHAKPIGFLQDMDSRIEADTLVGTIDAPSFVAAILDAVVTGYFAAVDTIEDAIDRLDAESLRRDLRDDLLRDLVGLRQRIARLRRLVSGHRELFASLGRSDFAVIAEGDVAAPFRGVAERFERAIDAVENGRELLLGSFDVYMTRTAQRTNEIVKILTIVSVLLLPGGVIAGFMGMNIKGPYSNDNPLLFWVVTALIAGLAVATLVVLRIRRWL